MKRALSILACGALALVAGKVWAAGVNSGVFTASQAERGRPIYAAECAACHGPTLGGGGGGPTLSGPFWTAWEGRSVGELFTLTKNSMPANGPGRLKDQEYADVVAYMLSVNGYVAGKAELPADPDALNGIDIVKRR